MSQKLYYDLCVIGGGLNGVAIARDAAGRGLSVLLIEKGDLAGAASSATSKLLSNAMPGFKKEGFLKILKSVKERNLLYKNFRHLLRPIDYVMPLDGNNAGKEFYKDFMWRFKVGVQNFFADKGVFGGACIKVLHFTDERLRALRNPVLEEVSEDISVMKPHERLRVLGNITEKDYAHHLERKVLLFSGCCVDDTRLVICNAVDAVSRGARIVTYTNCEGLQVRDGGWRVSLRDVRSGEAFDVNASMVVNATGAWVSDFLAKTGVGRSDPDLPKVKLVKNSYIILPRQYEGDYVYVLRQNDGNLVYVMPYEGKYTLVGSVEEECGHHSDGGVDDLIYNARISEEGMGYLLNACNEAFDKIVGKSDVVFSYSSVNPVIANDLAGKNSDDYFIYHHKRRDVPIISVYGGGIENFRVLAQDVVDRLVAFSGQIMGRWSDTESLFSANFGQEMEGYILGKKKEFPWLPDDLLRRYVYAYGCRMEVIIGQASSLDDLGKCYGDGVYEAELDYLKKYEWASCTQDVLWRRSKLALCVREENERFIGEVFFQNEEELLSEMCEEKALCA